MAVRYVQSLLALVLISCGSKEPPKPAEVEHVGKIDLGPSSDPFEKCYRVEKETGAFEFLGYRSCIDFLPPQKMKGIWITEFEGSAFRPTSDIGVPEGTNIWLEATEDMALRARAPRRRYFELDFIGSRAKNAGQYGHLGGAEQLVLVDRLISMREVSEKGVDRGQPGGGTDAAEGAGARG